MLSCGGALPPMTGRPVPRIEDVYLPEQVTGHLLAPASYDEWVERWGPIATPLLWSHAMFVTLAVELGLAGPNA